ncbi:MAG: bifunctional alpha,alpha-trehalose-phosphate synthase (UDP-forming)/trehalose-phosphatase [Candidatus Sericytochromatia bacterium]
MTLIIVSNRLPFSIDENGKIKQSSGGLVSAISGIKEDIQKKWVGIAPDKVSQKKWKKLDIDKKIYKPVFLEDPKLYKKYYNGISNDVLWPIFHYELSLNFNWDNWEAYKKVNYLIAEKINEVAKENDLIWIHDFHLFLVPQYLRKLGCKNKIGFFLHIPFPSSELFRQIPARKEILEGVLESDLIGFHDYSYLKHFCNSARAILGLESNLTNIFYNNKNINLGVFPVSIDTNKFIEASESKEVNEILNEITKTKNYEYLILGIDRLDYIKGFLLKLQAFRELLKCYPELVGKVSLLQIAIPSREDVPKYNELKKNVERLISEINGEFSSPNYTPIQYIYSSISFNKMIALYKLSDILFISSRRDGMNLVSFEYIASKKEGKSGCVVLSEFTGAASILSNAILINPWDLKETANKLFYALNISNKDKKIRNQQMIDYLINYTSTEWALSFINELEKPAYSSFYNKSIDLDLENLPLVFNKEKKKVLFIDYDGTLVPIENNPNKAILTSDKINLINKLTNNKNIEVVVISGRQGKFLENQFKDINNISLVAEHGAKFFDSNLKKWNSFQIINKEGWFNNSKKIMEDYSKRVPESFLELKEFSIAWHYRLSPKEFSEYQAKKLKEELEIGLANLPVNIILGNKVVEARANQANKGYFINWFLKNKTTLDNYTIIAIGDDTTDEDMFLAIKEKGISIKIGLNSSIAQYRIKDQANIDKFFNLLLN